MSTSDTNLLKLFKSDPDFDHRRDETPLEQQLRLLEEHVEALTYWIRAALRDAEVPPLSWARAAYTLEAIAAELEAAATFARDAEVTINRALGALDVANSTAFNPPATEPAADDEGARR